MKPPNWTPRRQNEKKAYQTQTESSTDKSDNTDSPSFNKEQLEHLYTLLNQSSMKLKSDPESHNASVAHSGNFTSPFETPWIIDSRAPDHNQESNPVMEPLPLNTQSDLDVPIASRKGTRTCTQHPISKFISYLKLSPSFKAFTTSLSDVVIPRNINEALGIPHWKAAVLDELRALKQNGTWELVDLPPDKKVIGCKWVFTVKYNADGSIERYKARLVAKGFTQTYGIDTLKHSPLLLNLTPSEY